MTAALPSTDPAGAPGGGSRTRVTGSARNHATINMSRMGASGSLNRKLQTLNFCGHARMVPRVRSRSNGDGTEPPF